RGARRSSRRASKDGPQAPAAILRDARKGALLRMTACMCLRFKDGWQRRRTRTRQAACPPSIHTTVILRCSPFFTASLEGWATSACGHPSRRAQGRAPQDDGVYVFAIQGWWARRNRAFAHPTASASGARTFASLQGEVKMCCAGRVTLRADHPRLVYTHRPFATLPPAEHFIFILGHCMTGLDRRAFLGMSVGAVSMLRNPVSAAAQTPACVPGGM